jgi:hypothetical protein
MKEQLLKQIGGDNFLKFSTSDFPNWDVKKHYQCLQLQGTWPEGYTLSFTINHGVHDWVLLKTNVKYSEPTTSNGSFIAALKNFEAAAKKLSGAWQDYKGEDSINRLYPFNKCFDDLAQADIRG